MEHGARPPLSYRPAARGAEATALPVAEEPGTLGTVLRYRPALLEPGTIYEGRLPGLEKPFRFQTQVDWPYKTDPPPFSFIMDPASTSMTRLTIVPASLTARVRASSPT